MNNHTLTPSAINHLKKDKVLRKLIDEIGIIELGIPNTDESFKSLVEIIVGQQLSVKAAKSIISRLQNKFGDSYKPADFSNISLDELREIGISNQKGVYILNLVEKINDNQINFNTFEELNNDEIIDRLITIKGIGVWSAKMFLISVLKRTNVFPLEDLTFTNQLKKLYNINDRNSEKKINELNNSWSPFQTFAAKYLWESKDKKIEFSS